MNPLIFVYCVVWLQGVLLFGKKFANRPKSAKAYECRGICGHKCHRKFPPDSRDDARPAAHKRGKTLLYIALTI